MRRSLVLLATVVPALVFATACEDGPNQTFSPAPPNAGSIWNNGDTPAAVDDGGGASFDATYGGSSKTEICSGSELQSQWARMVAQPIVPPYHMAGIDISGIDYAVLTVEQASEGINGALMPVMGATNPPTRLCQGANLGAGGNGGDIGGSLVTAWGNNNEFTMEWAVPTHKDYFNQINPGYVGSMNWTYTEPPAPNGDGKMHAFHWQLGKPITKDGAVFTLDWNGYSTPGPAFDAEADELYRGLTSYFAPDLYDNLPAGVFCVSSGRCPSFPTGNDGIHPILGFRTISMYWDMDPPVQPQPSGSTPNDAYFFDIKYAPYSPAVSFLKMDSVGPTGSLNPIGDLSPPKDCELTLGGTFGSLTSDCINVFMSSATNQEATAKVLGNLAHDDQNFTFSVVGINQNYRPPQLDIGGSRQFDIIHDNETPQPDALAVDFTLDVRANGPILNDRYCDMPTGNTCPLGVYDRDDHGSGAVWREYGRLVQQDLSTKYAAIHGTTPRPLHDPACLFPMSCQGAAACNGLAYGACGTTMGCSWAYNFPAGQDATTWRAPAGCTGFEGWLSEAYPNTKGSDGTPVSATDPTQTDPDNVWDVGYAFGSFSDNGLRPGTPYALICMDPGIYNFCGAPSLYGQGNDLLGSSYAQVLQIMGAGQANNLPPGTGDYRYFFQFFTEAYAKYLESGAALHLGQSVTPSDPVPYFGNFVLNTDDLFFDSFGGNANRSEFAQYDYADLTHDPTALNISMLLIGSNLQEVHYYRRLDREERALFIAMGNADGKAAGQASWGLLRNSSNQVVKDEWGQPRKNADMFISNIAGSPAIAAGPWSAPSDSMGNPIPVGTATAFDPCFPETPPAMVMKTAWYCATHLDPDCKYQAPTDNTGKILTRANGEPILSGYCGIWNPTPFALGSANIQLVNDDITVEQQTFEEEAEAVIPNYTNPYDPTSTPLAPIKVLVPWKPLQNGVGFPVATTGQEDIFVQTAQLDFSGQVVVPVMDYLPIAGTAPDGGPSTGTGVNILAYETQDFLGDAFLCYDTVTQGNRAGTPRPGDILLAHMYTSAQDILTWIGDHPTAQDNCTIIVRYSPYDNYPDYITSLTNGVRLGIDQGAGTGRVTDLTLFTPGVGAPAQP